MPTFSACCSNASYEETVLSTWRHSDAPASDRAVLLRELVRYATLAPSSRPAMETLIEYVVSGNSVLNTEGSPRQVRVNRTTRQLRCAEFIRSNR